MTNTNTKTKATLLVKLLGGKKVIELPINEVQKYGKEIASTYTDAQKQKLINSNPKLAKRYNIENGKFHMFVVCLVQLRGIGIKDCELFTINQINKMGLKLVKGSKRRAVVVTKGDNGKLFQYLNLFSLDQTEPSNF